MLRSFFGFFLVLFMAGTLSACSSSEEKTIEENIAQEDRPVEELYNEAADLLDQRKYRSAARAFDEVERVHPYSQWAEKSQVMAAYALYKGQRYDESILAVERYVKLHPGGDRVPYALYLKGLCFYEQIADVARDQEMTLEALKALREVATRFPETDYGRDSKLKLDLTMDHLAGKEMEVGRYYLARKQYQAALNRFRVVVKLFQTTTHVPEALHRMVESYLALGLRDEAVRVAAVLGYNFPGSQWYKDSYSRLDKTERQKLIDSRGIVDRTIDTIFLPD